LLRLMGGGAAGLALLPSLRGFAAPHLLPAFERRVGWAYTARSGMAPEAIRADLRRMRRLGANTLYISQSNPGKVDPDGFEPGMNPAAWFAITRGTAMREPAERVSQAVAAVLDASLEVGLDVILSIGYQIQMGPEWNDLNVDELRRNPDGSLMSHWDSGPTASPYSATYRRDIEMYYRWIDAGFVRRYPNIVAVNLADEPMGADFSQHAKATFQARSGMSFDEASAEEQGRFASGVIADFAGWSAELWRSLNPDVWTMMTFHIEREDPFQPDVERIFAQTPETFIFSADTHLDDGPPDRAITDDQVNLLFAMVRTLGWLSRVYQKRLMLWTSANAWGLKSTGGLAEAFRNLAIVHDTARDVDGQLAMLMAWGWNIRDQGVYDDGGVFAADKDQMIEGVTLALARVRDHLADAGGRPPSSVLHIPDASLQRLIGAGHFGHLASGVVDLSGVDFAAQRVVYLSDGRALEAARRGASEIVEYAEDRCVTPSVIRAARPCGDQPDSAISEPKIPSRL
jgi:hypothetical protein